MTTPTGSMSLIVVGAAGRMGQALIRTIAEIDGVHLAGAIERPGSDALGRDAGEMAGLGSNGVLITDAALDKALGSLSKSGDVFGQLASTPLDDELGLNVLANLTKKKVMSEKVRERVAGIWSNRSDLLRSDNHDANLYNLYSAVTQHLTDEVEETRFEYANRMSNQVLKAFERSAGSQTQFAKLTKAIPVDSQIVVTE